MRKYIANTITGSRILCSIALLFFPVFSSRFYVTYFLCGFSDMIDGTVARKTNSVSKAGARFDAVADFIFVAAALVKLLPSIDIPNWLWIWTIIIASIRISNITAGLATQKSFISLHTAMNKITGLFLFLLPLTLHFIELKYSSAAVCSLATVSAIQEGYYIITDHKIVSSCK